MIYLYMSGLDMSATDMSGTVMPGTDMSGTDMPDSDVSGTEMLLFFCIIKFIFKRHFMI